MAQTEQDSAVTIEHLDMQPVASIRTTIPTAELGNAMGERTRVLADFLRQNNIQPAGPVFVRYHSFTEAEADFEFGVPVSEPVAGDDRVAASSLPAGPVLTTWHIGAHDRLGEAYERIAVGLQQRNRESSGPAWEVDHWLDLIALSTGAAMPDVASWRTQLVQPLKEG